MNILKLLALGIVVSIASGCASYRTNSDVSFDSTSVARSIEEIKLLELGTDPVGDYESLGMVDAVVKKLTVFHDSPTKEQVNIVLVEKARKLNADAVINIFYKSGIGMTTWGYMEGKGEAIRFTEN